MKKLKLNANAQGSALNRNELKKVLGGVAGSGDPNPKQTACRGMSVGNTCAWSYNGTVYYGRCQAYAPNYVLHCSDLL